MMSRFTSAALVSLLAIQLPHTLLAADDAPPDSATQVWQVFTQNCIACHNAKKPEGGLNVETHAALMAGGDSGLSVVANDVAASALLERVQSADDPMPPDGNAVGARRLNESEITLLREWIATGAPAPSLPTSGASTTFAWQTLPASLQPSYAIAASRDGTYLAFGRGPYAIITDQRHPSSSSVQILSDMSLSSADTSTPAPTHRDFVNSMAFSPDSQRLATGGFRTVKLWVRDHSPVHTVEGLGSPTGTAAVSPSGKWLAQAVAPHGIEITDLAAGVSHRLLSLHASSVTALTWLDDNQLVSCNESNGMFRTDATQLTSVPIEMVGIDRIASLTSYNASSLAAIDNNKAMHLGQIQQHAETGQISATFTRQLADDQVLQLAVYGADAPRAAALLTNGHLKLISLNDNQLLADHDLGMPCNSVAISPDGKLLIALPNAGPAQIYKLDDGSRVVALERDYGRVYRAQTAERSIARQRGLADRLAAQVPELQKLVEQQTEATKKVQEARDKAAEELNTKAAVVDTATAEATTAEAALASAQAAVAEAMKLVEAKQVELEAKRKAIADAEQQKLVAAEELAKRDQALATSKESLDLAQGKVPSMEQRVAAEKSLLESLEQDLQKVQAEATSIAEPKHAVFTADDKLAVAYADQLRFFAADGRAMGTVSLPGPLAEFSLNDQQLIGLTEHGQAIHWRAAPTWKLERTLGGIDQTTFSDRITALAFSPDGHTLAVGSGPASRFGDIKLVNVSSGELVKDLGEAHSDTVLSIAFSPDGRWLASSGADKLCRVFNVSTGEQWRTLEGHTHHVLSVAWRDDGQVLVTGSADGSVKVWDVEPSVQLRTIGGFSKEVSSLNFVGTGSEFVTAAVDGSTRLYNADNGQVVRQFGGAQNALYTVALSADSDQVYAAGQNGQLWHWRLQDGQLLGTLSRD